MKISRFSYTDLLVSWLFVYFSSKLLWDTVPLVFELFSLAVIVICAVFQLFGKSAMNLHKTNLFITFIVFSIYIVANGLAQDNFSQLARAVYEYIFYALIFFAMMWLLPRADLHKCIKVVALWGIFVSCLSWWEYVTQSYLIADAVENYAGFRAIVFSRSYLSHGMILGIFALCCMHISYTERKAVWFVAGVFCFASILATSSRGPLVACGVALVVQFMMDAFISCRHSVKRLYACALLSVGVLAVLFVMVGTFETPVESVNIFLRRIRSITNWTGDSGNLGRILLWENALEWFKSNVWFGIGPSKTGSWGDGSIGVTESGVLKRLCELGIVGAGCFYYFLGTIFTHTAKKYPRQSNGTKRLIAFWLSMAIAVLINDITVQSTEEIMISFYLWTAFAGMECSADRAYVNRYNVEDS